MKALYASSILAAFMLACVPPSSGGGGNRNDDASNRPTQDADLSGTDGAIDGDGSMSGIGDADALSFAQIEQTIADFGRRARDNKIKLDELMGGTFSITNGGVYGSLLSTPIVNPPQSGILGMHGIVDRPVAVDGEVVIRPMMYVALTYDHRIVDGREAVTFLRRIKECVESPVRMLMEI